MYGDTNSHHGLIETAATLLNAVRKRQPRVHCITNAAAQVFTANLLLAAGALPSLTVAPDEIPFFTRRASSLLINLGTLDADRRTAIPAAIETARETEKVWVLDPVFVDISPPRFELARVLIEKKPHIIRCNHAEFEILFTRPVAPSALSTFAHAHRTVLALTGPIDHITDGKRHVSIANGHAWMSQTTAMGCAGTALLAAFAALEDDHFAASAAALLVLGVTGELTAKDATGPGTFPAAFLDRLSVLDYADLISHARINS